MRVLFTYSLTILLFASLTACSSSSADKSEPGQNPLYGKWQDANVPPIQFELELTFGDNDELMLPQIWQLQGPVTDSAGNIYFIDGQKGTMYSFEPDGDKRWETGEKGKGPGDFERPWGLATDGHFLYTANVNGSRIDQFDLDGNLVNSTTLEDLDLTFTSVVGFLSDSLLVTESTLMGEVAKEITVLNTKNNLDVISQFKIESTADINIPPEFGFSFRVQTGDTLITAGNVQDYAIPFFNSSGEKIKTVRRDFHKLMRPGFIGEESNRAMRSFGSLNAPIYLSNDYYLVELNWPTNVNNPDDFFKKSHNNDNAPELIFASSLDLFDGNGTLLYSMEQKSPTPEIGTISYADEEGYIYTKSNEPYPQIRRYKVTITPPE